MQDSKVACRQKRLKQRCSGVEKTSHHPLDEAYSRGDLSKWKVAAAGGLI